MARYHVCMVLVGKLPVPATLGGAVEALAQHLLEQNERDPQIEFTVLTVDEPKAQALAAGFRHAAFVWFKPHTLWNKVWWRVRTLALNVVKDTKIINDHQLICDAIANRDVEGARELMTKHLCRVKLDEKSIRAACPQYIKD